MMTQGVERRTLALERVDMGLGAPKLETPTLKKINFLQIHNLLQIFFSSWIWKKLETNITL